MCSWAQEPDTKNPGSYIEHRVSDCGHCQCGMSDSHGKHRPEMKTRTIEMGNGQTVTTHWRECARCGEVGV